MTLQQLKYVVAVAETGTISKASKEMFVSQPSLTNAIRELEKEMNINIFTRTNKGSVVSQDGEKFLRYARQVLEQASLLESTFKDNVKQKKKFCVSTQHYSFAVNAFVDLIKKYGEDEYDFSLRETETFEVIDDVAKIKSELGIVYLNSFNEKALGKIFKSNNIKFTELFTAKPHIFVSTSNPLARKKSVKMKDLAPYPYLSYEQGEHNSFYYSEEIFSTEERLKNIRVTDRATLFNLLIGLNGYTVCSGVIDNSLNGENIVSIPLDKEGMMKVGIITHNDIIRSEMANYYIDSLKKYINSDIV